MLVKMVTAGGEEHGLINVLSNHVADDGFKNVDPKIKGSLEKQRKNHAKKVKARMVGRSGGARSHNRCEYYTFTQKNWRIR